MKDLIGVGADPASKLSNVDPNNDYGFREGETILHVACRANHFELILHFILDFNAIDVNAEDSQKITPAQLLWDSNEDVYVDKAIRLLVKRGASLNHRDAEGKTPLTRAVIQNNLKVGSPFV
jgi:hypothetical protein